MAQVSLTEEFKAKIRAEMEKQTLEGGATGAAGADRSTSFADSGAYDELASLIGSLNVELKTPKTSSRSRQIEGEDLLGATRNLLRMAAEEELPNYAQGKGKPRSTGEEKKLADGVTAVKYGTFISIRNSTGRYLTACPVATTGNAKDLSVASFVPIESLPLSAVKNTASISYVLSVEGQGVGEELDCFALVNSDSREDQGVVRYGSVVSIKAPAAKDRFLSVRDGRIGFWRSLIGKAEKWVVLKALSTKGKENTAFDGSPICIGDTTLLLSQSTDMLLSMYDGIMGREARLVAKEHVGLGDEVMHIELFGSQPLPTWMHRPHLSGRFMSIPASVRFSAHEAEVRSFPGVLGSVSSSTNSVHFLDSYSPEQQQAILMRELLLVLTGVEGVYIRVTAPQKSERSSQFGDLQLQELTLVLSTENADRSAVSQIALLLPICECAIRVREFIKVHSRYEYGRVSHALAAGLKSILREFDLLVAQLEMLEMQSKLTVQKLVFHLQPSRTTLRALDRLCTRLQESTGGKMLDLLFNCLLEQGDDKTRELHSHLFKLASEPFVKTLRQWLFKGELEDPYGEFMIQENKAVSREALAEDFNAQYWEERYTIRQQHVPKVLKGHSNSLAQMVLTAGKYLNVVRGCYTGKDALQLPEEQDLRVDPDSISMLSRSVHDVYRFSSRALLRLLEERHGLSSHLRSLRRFFLLEHGDFFTQFMDVADEELRREAKDISPTRIQSLLQLAIQTSTLSNEAHREDLSCFLASHNLIQHLHLIQSAGDSTASATTSALPDTFTTQGLKGIEALTLDYKVGWPVSILLSKRSITKYQLLSRLLFFSKHVELRVLSGWHRDQGTKGLNVRGSLGASYCLRHRMLHFLQNFVYYMTLEVVSPRGHEMHSGMETASDMDQVIDLHEKFLDSCLKECLLASQDLLKILTKLMTTCLLFADQMKRVFQESHLPDSAISTESRVHGSEDVVANALQKQKREIQSEILNKEVSHEVFQRTLAKFTSTFDTQLAEFLEKLWTASSRQHPQLLNLCVRLDYNGYYSKLFSTTSSFDFTTTSSM